MKRRTLGLAEIAAATEINAGILERMSHEFPNGSDKQLFEQWTSSQIKLVKEIKPYLENGFEPFVKTHSDVNEWYNEFVHQHLDPLKEQLLTEKESSEIPWLGEMWAQLHLPLG